MKWRWLQSTEELQRETYGYDFRPGYYQGPDRQAALAEYLDWNQTAAVQELAEVREEFSWKPWAVDAPFANRDRIRDECIDVLHFVGNMLVAIGVDDAELEAYYKQKQDLNRRRKDSGHYSARKGGLSMGSDNS